MERQVLEAGCLEYDFTLVTWKRRSPPGIQIGVNSMLFNSLTYSLEEGLGELLWLALIEDWDDLLVTADPCDLQGIAQFLHAPLALQEVWTEHKYHHFGLLDMRNEAVPVEGFTMFCPSALFGAGEVLQVCTCETVPQVLNKPLVLGGMAQEGLQAKGGC